MNINQLIQSLKMNGFTEYESKIYISLLKNHPANGNMIALSSGVPGPKVYETLKKLQEKGYVYLSSGGDKSTGKSYIPMPYRNLITMFEETFKENISVLDSGFKKISESQRQIGMELFHIEGYEASIKVVQHEINNAKSEIYISGWVNEIKRVYQNLIKAHKKGIKIASVIFGENTLDIPWTNVEHYNIRIFNERHKSEMNIVFDEKKSMILETSIDNGYSVVSTHTAMVNTTKNYIRHDMYVNMIINDFEQEMLGKYGEEFRELISRF